MFYHFCPDINVSMTIDNETATNNFSPVHERTFYNTPSIHYGTRLYSKGAFVIPRVEWFGQKSFFMDVNCGPLYHLVLMKSPLSHFKVAVKQYLFDS